MPFQAIKTRSSKSRKIDIFPKGLNHGFVLEIGIFPTSFFRQYKPKNVFYDIQERKNAFLGYKNKMFKKSKNLHLSKRVNPWFWCKNNHFLQLFFKGNLG